MVFILSPVDVMYHIGRFVYTKPPLHPGNKSHLNVVTDFFNVLWGSVCKYFVEDFCIYVHQRYWPVALFFVVSLSGLVSG
uniref:Uncharacterized protein n=1 Tax=Lynx canadensis TaxID=61383 RepID=A0A667FRR9_LYNCA